MFLSKKYLQDAKCEILGLAPVVNLPIYEPEPDLEEKKMSPEPQALPAKNYQPVAPPESRVCSCILQGGSRKGQICGKIIKANGRCGMHQQKCIQVEEMLVEVQPPMQVVPPGTCGCILQGGTRKGQVCGKPTKSNGRCGTHQQKCVESVPIEVPPAVISTCGAIIQSGSRSGQPCGKPANFDGFCKTHQKKAVIGTAQIQPILVSHEETKCPCIIQTGKRQNQPCGRLLVRGQTYCRFHQTSCSLSEPVQQGGEEIIEPRVASEIPVVPSEVVTVVSVEPDPDQHEEPIDVREPNSPLPDPIETGEWTVVRVSEEELFSFLETTPIVDIHTNQLNLLESEIQKCFRL